ncbi:MAG: cyclic nucleotide-binding domain-containing protein, partial [Ghiorsea sp.]
ILEGKVNVKSESGYKFSSLRKGDVFGLFSFLDENRKHSATLTVERDTVALTLDRAYFDLISLEEPKLGQQLMRFMFSLMSKKASELEVEYAHMHNFAFGGKV